VANEEQANKARDAHSDLLANRGAHAIGVESGRAYGKQGFVVVAHVGDKTKSDIPDSLTVKHKGDTLKVPVVVKSSERFRPE